MPAPKSFLQYLLGATCQPYERFWFLVKFNCAFYSHYRLFLTIIYFQSLRVDIYIFTNQYYTIGYRLSCHSPVVSLFVWIDFLAVGFVKYHSFYDVNFPPVIPNCFILSRRIWWSPTWCSLSAKRSTSWRSASANSWRGSITSSTRTPSSGSTPPRKPYSRSSNSTAALRTLERVHCPHTHNTNNILRPILTNYCCLYGYSS